MSEEQIRADTQFLAGNLPNRLPVTENERAAAEYLRGRFKQYAPDAEIDDFYSIDNPYYLFASYYAEFLIVSIAAWWWPRLALCYGGAVFLAYLAEFMGHRVMGRFLPQYETQNVLARWFSPHPARQLVIMAHYDSGLAPPEIGVRFLPRLRWIHLALVSSMLLVIVSCATQALGLFEEARLPYDVIVRWAAAACLVSAAGFLYFYYWTAESARGANDNASGAAVLLELAERFAARPLEHADLCLVATGVNQAWMGGARHFLKTHGFDRDTTYFLNIDSVGRGGLCYATHEGMLHAFPTAPELIEAARELAPEHHARPVRLDPACSDAVMALSRGYKVIGITAQAAAPAEAGARNAPRTTDTLLDIDYAAIARAADFAEAIARRVSR